MTGRVRTRELPVFPVTAKPVRADVSPDVAAVEHHFGPVGSQEGPRIGLITLGCDKTRSTQSG